jgi:glycine cleavage system transcriptional repressor
MDTNLLICAYGPDRTGIVEEISNAALNNNANILDSRMSVLGDHFSILMLVSAPTTSLEALKRDTEKISNLSVSIKAIGIRSVKNDVFEYKVSIVGEDVKGIVHEITSYLKSINSNVITMDTSRGYAPHSGTQLFRMEILLETPKSENVRQFKTGLMDVCDRLNMDVDIEPTNR